MTVETSGMWYAQLKDLLDQYVKEKARWSGKASTITEENIYKNYGHAYVLPERKEYVRQVDIISLAWLWLEIVSIDWAVMPKSLYVAYDDWTKEQQFVDWESHYVFVDTSRWSRRLVYEDVSWREHVIPLWIYISSDTSSCKQQVTIDLTDMQKKSALEIMWGYWIDKIKERKTLIHESEKFACRADMLDALFVYVIGELEKYPDISNVFESQLLDSAITMKKFLLDENVLKYKWSNFDILNKKKQKYLYFYEKVKTWWEWDYKNVSSYAWHSHIVIEWNLYPVDVTWNFAFGYSASAWWIPFVIQSLWSSSAQIKLDVSNAFKNDYRYNPISTYLNEKSDIDIIYKWALLYKHYWEKISSDLINKYLRWEFSNIQSNITGDIFYFVD